MSVFYITFFVYYGVPKISKGVHISNERAIRCYEKCGFSKVKKINNESALLMELKTTKL